jgi:hypothetical protein
VPPKPRHHTRLLVDEGGLYPGMPPRRIRLGRTRRAPLSAGDVERLIGHATTSVAALTERFAQQLAAPFGAARAAVLFRPAALVQHGAQVGALDADGAYLALGWLSSWTQDVPKLLPHASSFALFGLHELEAAGPRLRSLSIVSPALRWARGPLYPDLG